MERFQVYTYPVETDGDGQPDTSDLPDYQYSDTLERCELWAASHITAVRPDYDFDAMKFSGKVETFYVWPEESEKGGHIAWIIIKPEPQVLTKWRRNEKGLLVNKQTITSNGGIDYLKTMGVGQCRNARLTSDCTWAESTDGDGAPIYTLEAEHPSEHKTFLFMISTPRHVLALEDELPYDHDVEFSDDYD